MENDHGILSDHPSGEEESQVEITLRPQKLREYIGQPKIKHELEVYIKAAQSREEALDHVLLYGPPGLGKTTLAMVIANEMGVNIKTTSGPAIEKPGDLVALLNELKPGMSFLLMKSTGYPRLWKKCFTQRWKIIILILLLVRDRLRIPFIFPFRHLL